MQDEQNTNAPETETTEMTTAEAGTPADAATETAAVAAPQTGRRKVRTGLVVSNKMQKSIVVEVVRRVRHPIYKKYFNRTKRYMAHDANNECGIGDTVRIVETRPLSAHKRWALEQIVERAR